METDFGEFRSVAELLKERNIVLRGADVITQGGFTQVPNSLLKSPDLSVGAKLTYAMLLHYAWQHDFCFPGQARLAKDMGTSLRSASSYIKELEGRGYVHIKRRGLGRPNVYELHVRATRSPERRRASRHAKFARLEVQKVGI